MSRTLRIAFNGQLQMIKHFGLTLIPGYLFGAGAVLGAIAGITLSILRATGTLETTAGNLFTIFAAAVFSGLIALVLMVITAVQFARHGGEFASAMMASAEAEMNRTTRQRTQRPTLRKS